MRPRTLLLLVAVLAASCSNYVSVERPEELIFSFLYLEGVEDEWTVVLSERDAATLGSETESTTRTEIPDFEDSATGVGPRYKLFEASNFVDTIDGDLRHNRNPPCLEDPVLIRNPQGIESELLPDGYCISTSWVVVDRTVNSQGRP